MNTTVDKNSLINLDALAGFGKRLKIARETMRLTEKDVALRLHLNSDVIALIENESYESGPPLIFLKGYLRSYARLVSLPEAEINQVLGKLESTSSTTVFQQRRNKQKSNPYMRWVTYLIVVVLIGLVAMWWSSHSSSNVIDKPIVQPMHPTAQPSAALTIPTHPVLPAVVSTDKQLSTAGTPTASQPVTPTVVASAPVAPTPQMTPAPVPNIAADPAKTSAPFAANQASAVPPVAATPGPTATTKAPTVASTQQKTSPTLEKKPEAATDESTESLASNSDNDADSATDSEDTTTDKTETPHPVTITGDN